MESTFSSVKMQTPNSVKMQDSKSWKLFLWNHETTCFLLWPPQFRPLKMVQTVPCATPKFKTVVDFFVYISSVTKFFFLDCFCYTFWCKVQKSLLPRMKPLSHNSSKFLDKIEKYFWKEACGFGARTNLFFQCICFQVKCLWYGIILPSVLSEAFFSARHDSFQPAIVGKLHSKIWHTLWLVFDLNYSLLIGNAKWYGAELSLGTIYQ